MGYSSILIKYLLHLKIYIFIGLILFLIHINILHIYVVGLIINDLMFNAETEADLLNNQHLSLNYNTADYINFLSSKDFYTIFL